ncbi:MAG: pyruvoyl-dependent arginine decarboxylase [Minisyncoccia bacterium]
MKEVNKIQTEKTVQKGEDLKVEEEEGPARNLIGNRIPKDYFWTSGQGESDIAIHAGSYHLALRQAGIEMCNIMSYSSIMPEIAKQVYRPKNLIHGSVMESIIAVADAGKGERATAGIIYGWLHDKETGQRHGGLVCEYNGNDKEVHAREQLKLSLNELYTNGYNDKYDLKNLKMTTRSFVPKKKHGTALVAICFLNYVYPIIG